MRPSASPWSLRGDRPRQPAPWLRSSTEPLPRRSIRPAEVALVLLLAAAVIAMAVWFLLLASGGLTWGSL